MQALRAGEIAELLAERAEQVCRELLPAGKTKGHEYEVGSTDGEFGKSLKVRLEGNKTGVWSDFGTGQSGDLLDLWASVRHLGIHEAMTQAKTFLGIGGTELISSSKNYKKPSIVAEPLGTHRDGAMDYLAGRGIDLETCEAFGVLEYEKSGQHWIVWPFYRGGELRNVKYMPVARREDGGKNEPSFAGGCEITLFGWQALDPSTRTVVLTEGEIDCLTVSQMGFHALSVPNGASGMSWIQNDFDAMQRFDEIFICFDNDPAGQKGVAEVVARLGEHRCRIVQWPNGVNDPNDALQQGWNRGQFEALFHAARTSDPDELHNAGDYVSDVLAEFFPPEGANRGLPTPWKKVGDNLLFRPGETTIVGGINGHGKSLMLGQIVVNGIGQGRRFCIASMEMLPARTLRRMAHQVTGMPNPSHDYIRDTIQWLGGGLWLFDLVGTAKTERLLQVFRYAWRRYKIDHFVIDSLAKCGINEDDYNRQKAFVEQLVDFAHETKSHVYIVAHPRKSEDEFRSPGKMDVKGTGAITDMVDNVITVWRNKRKEAELADLDIGELPPPDSIEKPDAALTVCKQRTTGWEGRVWLWFDQASQQYLGNREHRPWQYLRYDNRTRQAS